VTISHPHLWQGKADPYLYQVSVEIRDAGSGTATDVVTQPLGLRSIRVDPATGFFLNGVHPALHGVNRHQDTLGRGTALTTAR
jgi:beta-galactosidase